jgi:hypothetical protein
VRCTFADGRALVAGTAYTLTMTDATVLLGATTVPGVRAAATFGSAAFALVAHGSAQGNMGLGTDPSTRAVAFDPADTPRFAAPAGSNLRTLYVRATLKAGGAAVGFVGARAVGVSTNGGASFAACGAFDALGVGAQEDLVRGLAGPYFRRAPRADGPALLGVFLGGGLVALSGVVVAVDGLALEAGLGQDARLLCP